MDSRTYVPSTYSLKVGTTQGDVHSNTTLTKSELRQRVDAWFKDENSLVLHVKVEKLIAHG